MIDLSEPIDAQDMLGSGATYRQVDYWWRQGFFRHSDQAESPTPGTGYPRDWTMREFTIASLIVRLRKAGVELAVAAEWARDAVDNGTTRAELAEGITISWNVAS